jgi:hypothetical protein
MLRHGDCVNLYNKIEDVHEAVDTSRRALEAWNKVWKLLNKGIVIPCVIKHDGKDLKSNLMFLYTRRITVACLRLNPVIM